MRLLKLLQNFSGVGVKRRIVPHKIPYNFALGSEAKFQIEFESQIKTSFMFLNKFILGIFVQILFLKSYGSKNFTKLLLNLLTHNST